MQARADEDFEAFVRARYPVLLRAATLLTGDHHLAQDVLQDALMKLARRWDRLKEENPDAYLRRILYNENISRWRRVRRETPIDTILAEQRPVGGQEPVDPGMRVTALDVRHALQQLTVKQRAVLVLRYYEDLSEAQIADVLGVSQGTVKSQAHAALRGLKRVLPDAPAVPIGLEEPR